VGSLSLALLLCALLFAPPDAGAQGLPAADSGEPALIEADSITYEETLGIVTARGNVQISQGGRVLVADSVSYNINTDVVTASGNVALLEDTGDVLFANYMEVTGDLKEGFIRDIRVLMIDNSRMAAASGVRTGGNRTELSKTVYSPCALCEEDPTRAPLWQIKADKVVWDEEKQVIFYHDATLEFFGIPVFYTPYFEHPDPTVTRKSGLLQPSFGTSDQLGFIAEIPYFIVLDDTSDITIAPIITSRQGFVGQGEYRKLFEKGYLEIEGSATLGDIDTEDQDEKNQFRGAIFSEGKFDIDETYRWGYQLQRTTDDTYLRVYNLGDESTLISRAYIEGFEGRGYQSLQTLAYQGLREEDVNDQQPIVVPLGEYTYISEPDKLGGVTQFDANVLQLVRIEGRDVRRLSVAGSWTMPFTASTGEVYTFIARLQADGYWSNDFDVDDPDNFDPPDGQNDVFSGRILPEVALQWRYPFIRHGETSRQVIEPIVQVRLAPPNVNPAGIPNEDSLDVEFDDTNLFSLSRFPGLDRVDPGPRLDYGLKWSTFEDDGGFTSVFVGQSYRPLNDDDGVFTEGSGLEDHVSDIVGHIRANPAPWLDLSYRFRIDQETFGFDRHEVSLYAGIPEFNITLDYLYADKLLSQETDDELLEDRNEIYVRLGSQFTDEWSGFVSYRYDFEAAETLEGAIGLQYEDECFVIQAVYERTNYRDREVEPDNAVFVRIGLRNLGEIAVD